MKLDMKILRYIHFMTSFYVLFFTINTLIVLFCPGVRNELTFNMLDDLDLFTLSILFIVLSFISLLIIFIGLIIRLIYNFYKKIIFKGS